MFHWLIIPIYYYHHLLLLLVVRTTSASPLLFTLDDVRYSLSDRILTIPKLGALRGIHIDYEHGIKNDRYLSDYGLVNIEAFLGIQYGLYHGRFEPSKERLEHQPSPQVNKYIEFGPACAQHIWTNESELNRIRTNQFVKYYYPKLLKFIRIQNEEQCLYMNIYQPQIKDLKELLPVLLFVHGDGYDMGTGAAFDGAVFASYTKAIVVTINYRLGPFGFLYVSRENKGDYALQDIYTALHWLKNYVNYFNGDPDRITLYGSGTGAVLASLVVMLETVNGGTGTVKRRKPLVHRLILNDQSFLSPSMTSTASEISSLTVDFLSHLSCSTSTCLRNQSSILTNDLLTLNTYSSRQYEQDFNYLCPLEDPFPFFFSNKNKKDNSFSPLRTKFFHESRTLLPENLDILITMSPTSIRGSKSSSSFKEHNWKKTSPNMIEHLLTYAYTRWNIKTNKFESDMHGYNYHHQIVAPLLQYASHINDNKRVYAIERYHDHHSILYDSELPLTFGYVLAPSMSVYNDTYAHASENDRIQSMRIMDLFANLMHNGDINIKSPYCKRTRCEPIETWHPIFPEFNFLILKDGNLTQTRGHHAQVHYLFNEIIAKLNESSMDADLLHAWKTLYQVSHNRSSSSSSRIDGLRSAILFHDQTTLPLVNSISNSQKLIFILCSSGLLIVAINLLFCLIFARRGHGCRKREYNCLNGQTSLNVEKQQQEPLQQRQHGGGSSPTSTNSNGTTTLDSSQQLIVNTISHEHENHSPLSSLLCTTTNSVSSTTPPVDILHPVNITKKNGILKCSSVKKSPILVPPSLPEAIV